MSPIAKSSVGCRAETLGKSTARREKLRAQSGHDSRGVVRHDAVRAEGNESFRFVRVVHRPEVDGESELVELPEHARRIDAKGTCVRRDLRASAGGSTPLKDPRNEPSLDEIDARKRHL